MSETTRDLVGYYLEEMERHGRNDRTTAAYERVLGDFESFVTEQGETPRTATHRTCLEWVHGLRTDHAESTVATYASYLNRFYDYLGRLGEVDGNPMELVLEEMDESVDVNPTRRDVSVEAMREFVSTVGHPLHRAVIVTLLKTGMRAGELANLDMIDLNLDHPGVTDSPRAQVATRPDSVFVSADHTYNRESGGEVRIASNKRERSTVIPVDDELKRALLCWLAVRPDTQTTPSPVFVGTAEGWGERISPHSVHHIVETYARRHGWYRTGGGASENVTPHYFRHFFTTHLRDRTGDRGIVKYLRGDVADDVIETYTHDWGDRVRETYLESIYRLE